MEIFATFIAIVLDSNKIKIVEKYMLSRFKIGHFTDLENITGCTVILPPENNVTSAAARGASPGSREYALLSPKRKISQVQAIVLTGGSAFGLNCAHGVMEALAKQKIGYQTNFGLVPIVPAAVIFDKNIGNNDAYPTAEQAQLALKEATFNNQVQGNVGVGCGATVGKYRGMPFAVKGGLGFAQHEHLGVKAAALTVVNAVGDVFEKNGKIIAGARTEKGTFAATENRFGQWDKLQIGLAENTVLSVVMTNAILSKQQAHFIAERAHHGIARRIEPSHTNFDGDITFVSASMEVEANLDLLSGLAVAAVEDSILNGIKAAESIADVPAWKDL